MFEMVAGWPGLGAEAAMSDGQPADGWPDAPLDGLVSCDPGSVLPLLADAPPGAGTVTWLAATDPAAVDRDELIDLLVAYERAAAWLAGRQQQVLAELAGRAVPGGLTGEAPVRTLSGPGAEPARPKPLEAKEALECVQAEVAAALRLSMTTAGRRISVAETLGGRLAATGAALTKGEINYLQASSLAEASFALADDTAAAVQNRVLPRMPSQSVAETRRAITRAVLAADPRKAAERREEAAAQRDVTHWPLPDGMAELRAVLPALAAATVWDTIKAAAGRSGPDDPRPAAARRADALVALVTGLGRPVPTGSEAVDSAGHGTGEQFSDDWVDGPAASEAGFGGAPAGTGGSAWAGPPTGGTATPAGRGVVLHITISAASLLGATDEPAELSGYGPISPDAAREIAGQARWRRVVTDPIGGTLLDYGRTVYRPPAGLADHVRTRDGTCRFPHCGRRAANCELDHTTPWSAGGTTAAANLGSVCPQHHRLKTAGCWQLQQRRPGDFEWTSPTGHRYRRDASDIADP